MNDLKRFERLQQQATEHSQAQSRAEGELAAAIHRLREEFGVSSLKAAKRLVAKIERRIAREEKELSNVLDKLERQITAIEDSSGRPDRQT